MPETIAIQAKICGLSSVETICAAVEAGASYIGFVFFERSPRNITPEKACDLAAHIPDHIQKVGVFVDPTDQELTAILDQVPLDLIQLHGSENPERVNHIKATFNLPVMKAIAISSAQDIEKAKKYQDTADMLLFDAKAPASMTDSLPGGNGLGFDWTLIKGITWEIPWMLSGGLDEFNVKVAITTSGANMVDVSSGVEDNPGKKSISKINNFMRAAQGSIMTDNKNTYKKTPDSEGRFGMFGGRFVSETLMPLILDLEKAYKNSKNDPAFQKEFDLLLSEFVGRPSPLYFAERITDHLKGAKVYFKREELNHTGAHKINNCIGQILLAQRMGKTRIIAETGAGQHGVATATVCARFGMKCVIYMGVKDIERQKPNVFRMKLLGAEVIPVTCGSKSLKDAMNEAMRDWVANVEDTFYIIGTAAGPHPYPELVRDFQSIIGRETREQIMLKEGRLPDSLVACVGGGSNAIGLFHEFLDDDIKIYGVEAAGYGLDTDKHAASLSGGKPGVLHGNRTYLLMDENGQIEEAHSISAGLDYPGIGPEHSWLHAEGRVKYVPITDKEALKAFQFCTEMEGIIPALESAHAIAWVMKLAPTLPKDHIMVMCLSGRGDKDIFTVADALGTEI